MLLTFLGGVCHFELTVFGPRDQTPKLAEWQRALVARAASYLTA